MSTARKRCEMRSASGTRLARNGSRAGGFFSMPALGKEALTMRRLYAPFLGGRGGLGLLFLRLVVGTAFILHGWQKIGNPFHWMDKSPSAPPAFLQGMGVFAEVGGGALLILGLLTPIATFLLACDMGYALAFVHLPKGDPFVAATANGPSYERALVYLAVSIAVMLAGPGRYALDALLFRREPRVLAGENVWARPPAA